MISPTTIAAVKERTDLVALIGESVKLARKGKAADITLALWDEARAVMKKQAARWAP